MSEGVMASKMKSIAGDDEERQSYILKDAGVKIPVTMCHGLNDDLTIERFRQYMQIASEMGFSSINYDQLYGWLIGETSLPENPIMFDFDHPILNICTKIFPLMQEFGFRGNLFVNTGFYDKICAEMAAKTGQPFCASWDDIALLMETGWTIGAHTHSHPDLSDLAQIDPTGELIGAEMDKNNSFIKHHLGRAPNYFAFTGGETGLTWSQSVNREAEKRYKLGRLWIVGQPVKADERMIRYADLVGVEGLDEADGGPPHEARYVTKQTPHLKIPSMELQQALIYEPEDFRRYLSMAQQ